MTQFLVGQQGLGWNVVGVTNQFTSGAAAYYRNSYVATVGGAMSLAHVFWPNGGTANFVKVCVYDKVSGQLLAVSGPIAKPLSAPFDASAVIAGTLSPGQIVYLVTVPDSGFWAGAQNSGASTFVENQNSPANFSYTNPPLTLPNPDSNANGSEQIVWIEGTPAPAQFLCGQQGVGWTIQGVTNQNSAGNASYLRNGYVAPVGGTLVNAHVYWPAGGSPFVKVCVYDFLTNNLIAVSQPIARPNQAPFDAFAPISGFLTPGQRVYLVTTPSDGSYWGGAQNQGTSAFVDNQNVVANFPYASPPAVLPASDVTAGNEQIIWLEGFPALISETNVIFTPTIVAPIRVLPGTGKITIASDPQNVVGKTNPVPNSATLSLIGAGVQLALGLRINPGAITMGGSAPTLQRSSGATIQTGLGAVSMAGIAPIVNTGSPGSISARQPLTVNAPGGTGFGTKSLSPINPRPFGAFGPILWDDASDAPLGVNQVSPQWTHVGPVSGVGNQNMQNQPAGYTASGGDIGMPHQFLPGVLSGIHYTLANDGNGVYTAKTFNVPATYPFCIRQEFYVRYDFNWVPDPRSDQNIKDGNLNDGTDIFPQGGLNFGNFYYTSYPARTGNVVDTCRTIDNTNPCVVHYAVPLASNPLAAGQTMAFYGMPASLTALNGQFFVVTAVGGLNNNWTATLGALDATTLGVHPGFLPVTAVTKGPNAQITFTSNLPSNPAAIGTAVTFEGLGGMAQLNQPNGKVANVTNISGTAPNYTVTTDLDTSSFTAYTSGGNIFFGMAPRVFGPWDPQTGNYVNDGASQGGNPPGSNPMFQGPNDENGHNSTNWGSAFNASYQANGWIKRVFEQCVDNNIGGPGYLRITDMSQGQMTRSVITAYAGKTDNTATADGHLCWSQGNYSRDRDPVRNARYYTQGYIDCSAAGVTGQCACVYVGDQPTFAACVILEIQPFISSWTNTQIQISKFNQGALQTGSTGYIYVCRETDAAGTALASGSFPIGATSLPVITNVGSLPTATSGVAYTAGIGVSGGTPPYNISIAYAAPNTGNWLTVTDPVNGILGGTPTTVENETVFVSVLDAAGNSSYKILPLSVVAAANFYVATNGNDANPGTLAQPWAKTSLIFGNANNSKIAGKRVGLIQGSFDYTGIDSGQDPLNYTRPVIHLPPGTIANPTTLISVSPTGSYAPRTSTILYNTGNVDNTRGAVNMICGQGYLSGNQGFYTLDGVLINGQGYASKFAGADTDSHGTVFSNIIIKNNEFANLLGKGGGGNFSMVWFAGTTLNQTFNNYFHDATSTGGQPDHTHGYEEYGSTLNQTYQNTFSACQSAIDLKLDATGGNIFANYFVNNQNNCILGIDGNQRSNNNPYSVHHNIFDLNVVGVGCHSGDLNGGFDLPISWYNNTVYCSAATGTNAMPMIINSQTSGAVVTCYNNIVVTAPNSGGSQGYGGGVTFTQNGQALLDYNCYFSTTNYSSWFGWFTSAGVRTQIGSFATWQTTSGKDAHTLNVNPQFRTTIVPAAGVTQYQLAPGSPCVNAGRIGGVSTGAATNMGAWDGTYTQIGCNFGPYAQ